jgi:hydroxymethylpyrimidine pyrophosphatase-like HAD family hydrolase
MISTLQTVTLLKNVLNVKQENTIGVGDGHNDIHLFSAVKHKVAMGNAVDELKAASDKVIGSAEDEGFAQYLEGLLANQITR